MHVNENTGKILCLEIYILVVREIAREREKRDRETKRTHIDYHIPYRRNFWNKMEGKMTSAICVWYLRKEMWKKMYTNVNITC